MLCPNSQPSASALVTGDTPETLLRRQSAPTVPNLSQASLQAKIIIYGALNIYEYSVFISMFPSIILK